MLNQSPISGREKMSKVLPVAAAVILSGIALAPVAYSIANPANPNQISSAGAKLDENAKPIQKLSYGLGYALAQQVPAEADTASFMRGYNDARNNKDSLYTNEQLNEASQAYAQELENNARPEAPQATTSEKPTSPAAAVTAEEAKAFFAENAKKEGVKTTASGLQYKIITEGTGKQATADSKVTVHYTGKLLNGQEFDSSAKHGQPITFPLNAVIKGWTEGLALMKEGTKAELYIPAELAYGSQERPNIPANSPLIFEIELLKVE